MKKVQFFTVSWLVLLVSVPFAALSYASVPEPVASNISPASGTINFQGVILNSACQVNGTNGTAINVNLGQWPASEFNAVAKTSPTKSFTVNLTGCPTDASIDIEFTGNTVANNDVGVPLLSLNSNGAQGVGVEILQGSYPINIGNSDFGRAAQSIKADKSGDASFKFNANYYSYLPKVSAGAANAIADFTISYS